MITFITIAGALEKRCARGGRVASVFASVALFLSGCSALLNDDRSSSSITPSQALILEVMPDFDKELSRAGRGSLAAAERRALNVGRAGQAIEWQQSRGDARGSVTAFQHFRVGEANCRQFRHDLAIGGKQRSASGTACKRQNDVWRIVR